MTTTMRTQMEFDDARSTIMPNGTGFKLQDEASKTIAQIPGVGLLTATAAMATMGDAKAFKSGREFPAWRGLVPRQVGTGGKVRLLGISKRGDRYLPRCWYTAPVRC